MGSNPATPNARRVDEMKLSTPFLFNIYIYIHIYIYIYIYIYEINESKGRKKIMITQWLDIYAVLKLHLPRTVVVHPDYQLEITNSNNTGKMV